MGEMDAYKDVFLSESAEFIQGITDGLIALEQNPGDLDPVETIFRGAHSLKGMAATMGYERTAELTHKMESLMDLVRRRERIADEELVDLMLEAVDKVRDLIDDESSGGSAIDPAELVSRIVAFTEAAPRSDLEAADEAAASQESEAGAAGQGVPVPGAGETYSVVTTLDEACVLKSVRAYMVIKRLSHMGEVLDTVPSGQEIEDEQFDRDFAVILQTSGTPIEIEQAVLAVSEIEKVTVEEREQPAPELAQDIDSALAEASRRGQMPKLSQTQTVRVAIGHLDNMVDLVGELVTIKARLEDMASSSDDSRLNHTVEEFQRIVGDLQHEVMLTRMVPVDHIFNRFPRMVRDLARDLGKDLEFQMRGADIELDRTVLDEIGDPIVHLLRNSIDHGIEPPEERAAAGKPEKGTVRLVAERVRDHVRIAVSDDGRGIDCDTVWSKAVDRGIVEDEERETFSEDQILQFTCVPGFSTTDAATKVSGRGVGMDVVKGKIEYLGGTLEINSQPGVGSEFVLSLPLTLAIVQALLVRSAEQTYALPLAAIDEILSSADVNVDTVDGAPVVVHRDGEVDPALPARCSTRRERRPAPTPITDRAHRPRRLGGSSASAPHGQAPGPPRDRHQAARSDVQGSQRPGWSSGAR